MANLSLKHIYKIYDDEVKAVNDFCMDIKDKEFIVFVGPSGCGKSTTLRMIAGLEEITAGELRIDDVIVNDLEPKDRNIAMVFQNYALYPHMSVYENMAFALKTAKVPKNIIEEKVKEAAEILGITQYLERKPKALSGGQRQRVALGRAIVRNPKVFLLDEPLSNLDAKLRAAMRAEISKLHEKLQTTFIYVTHDQVEAMTMGTRIVVMKDGFVQQIDTPKNLFKYPVNIFVAGFIGTPQMNFFDAKITKKDSLVRFELECGANISEEYAEIDKIPIGYMDGQIPVVVGIRPDDVKLDDVAYNEQEWGKADARVTLVESLGGETLIYADMNVKNTSDKHGIVVVKAGADSEIKKDDIIKVAIKKSNLYFFDKETQLNIKPRIPKENILDCVIKNGRLYFGKQELKLPPVFENLKSGECKIAVPPEAVVLGEGRAKAKISSAEVIEDKVLYRLEILNNDENFNGAPLFALELGKQCFDEGEKIVFDIDFSKVSIKEQNIEPIEKTNVLKCTFVKKRGDKKKYKFYFDIENQLLKADEAICEKLFASKGTQIFDIPLEMVFMPDSIEAEKYVSDGLDSIAGKVTDVFDYGMKCFAKVRVGSSDIIIMHKCEIGEKLSIRFNEKGFNVKDKTKDIIIV
ncbi:MAG: sn-glycerol-3-phosphate ABC transporter ATP-binding protein UgpC [Ruminococcaceae bacterium]|nr:sn-glycerol-3-phosphate ABC transporter ATP-binding protein UgpC [Oscillospiraceae bacterium]